MRMLTSSFSASGGMVDVSHLTVFLKGLTQKSPEAGAVILTVNWPVATLRLTAAASAIGDAVVKETKARTERRVVMSLVMSCITEVAENTITNNKYGVT